jgi:hypothetical protein
MTNTLILWRCVVAHLASSKKMSSASVWLMPSDAIGCYQTKNAALLIS